MGVLAGKVGLITGGESGIGLASARLFVNEGAQVHLLGLDETKLKATVDEFGPDRALASVADVADENAVQEAVRVGVDCFGGTTSCSAMPGTAARSPTSSTIRRRCSPGRWRSTSWGPSTC
jgi:NADP-dependent 3-hydroxy acid dehydrogenase YdfG